MEIALRIRSATQWLAAGIGLTAACYAAYVSIAWARYGYTIGRPPDPDADTLLDRFMPEYEVVERHHIRVSAPAEITFSAACDMDLTKSAIVRAIFQTRALILGAKPAKPGPSGLLAQAKAQGWGVLAEVPNREIVMGAVTQPWAADIVFRAIAPEEFAAFREPGYVKIVWTLRSDPAGSSMSIHRTETRATTTDAVARMKFRRYWAAFSPGIVLIRRIGIHLVREQAEHRSTALRETTAGRMN